MSTQIQVSVSPFAQISVHSMHRGHHAIWLSSAFQVDVCNMIDDLMIRELVRGHLYRFPLTPEILSWVTELFSAMTMADDSAQSPWLASNQSTRQSVLEAIRRRLIMKEEGMPTEAAGGNVAVSIDPLGRNIFEPGDISPAIKHYTSLSAVTSMLALKIAIDGRNHLVE